MFLGGGELGKEVVIELQRLGVEVIVVDRYANAPAQQVAHRAHVIDMTDAKALRALVEQERPHLIVPRDRSHRHGRTRAHRGRCSRRDPDSEKPRTTR
jgi:formate-dependent phosphoribosylglycinamide formyltransferase (GAR transformylase)